MYKRTAHFFITVCFVMTCLPMQARAKRKASDVAEMGLFDKAALFDDLAVNTKIPKEYKVRFHKKKKYADVGYALSDTLSSVFSNVFNLHKNLFTFNTLKVMSIIFPFFVGARMLDEQLQGVFYNARWHKNINQMPDCCHALARYSIALPIAFLGADAFFGKTDEKRWTGQILLLGIPFVIFANKTIKGVEFDACFRPWNEHFSCVKRSYGGFPSGHMAQAIYMTVLYGMRYGARYAIPLGMIAAFLGINFLTCNRHYTSQLVAGAGFGSIYALAASKVVDTRLADHMKMGMGIDTAGRPTFSLAFRW